MAAKKGGLGKGLDAIFMENATENSNSTVTLKISELEPNQDQPRREFDDEALAELADSIAQHGVLQPLLVRPTAVHRPRSGSRLRRLALPTGAGALRAGR